MTKQYSGVRIAHILGILLMNSCNTDIFFSDYYHLQSVRIELGALKPFQPIITLGYIFILRAFLEFVDCLYGGNVVLMHYKANHLLVHCLVI